MIALALIVAVSTDTPSIGSSTDLVEFLLAQNQSSRSMVAAVDYRFTFETDAFITPHGFVHGQGDGRLVVTDTNRYAELHRITEVRTGGADAKRSEQTTRWVLNDNYFAIWSGGDSAVQIFDHDSIESMGQHARALMDGERGPNILLYAFGTSEETLRDAMSKRHDDVRWMVRKKDGANGIFELMCFSPVVNIPGVPTFIFQLNAGERFLVNRSTAYAADGTISTVRQIVNRHISNGLWLPESVTGTSYMSSLPASIREGVKKQRDITLPEDEIGIIVRRSSIRILDVQVRSPEAGEFELGALQLPDGHPGFQVHTDGKLNSCRFERGTLVRTSADQTPHTK